MPLRMKDGADPERLRRQAQLFEKIQRAARIGGWELDVATQTLAWTDETYRLHGLSPDRYTPTVESAIAFYAPDAQAAIRAAVAAAIDAGSSYDLEVELSTAKGERRWVRTRGYCESIDGAVHRLYGTFQDVTDRRALEQAVLLTAQEERERFGGQLHDGIGQELTGTALLLRSLVARAHSFDPALAGEIEYATGLVNRALEGCRLLAHDVAPASPVRGGLEAALRKLAAAGQRSSGIMIKVKISAHAAATLDMVTGGQLYLIAQEALVNAMKHSGASHIDLELLERMDALRLRVVDDGRGVFTAPSKAPLGMGIRIMRHRARLINARLDIRTSPQKGTLVRCVLRHRAAAAGGDDPAPTPGTLP